MNGPCRELNTESNQVQGGKFLVTLHLYRRAMFFAEAFAKENGSTIPKQYS